MHWPEPVLIGAHERDAGPVMVTVEYRVSAENREHFLADIERIARARKRDGAYAWGIFEDAADPGRFLETFFLDSWLEHLRQHQRVTKADEDAQESLLKELSESTRVTHYIA